MAYYLSIVIPHRNTPDKLARLLGTVPNCSDLEVVVIDDNSDNEHKADKIQAQFPWVYFLRNPGPDHNAGSARNYGLDHVNAEWVLFADADDCFTYNAFETIRQKLAAVGPDVDIVFFGTTSCHEESRKTASRHSIYTTVLADCVNKRCEMGVRYQWPGPISKAIRLRLINERKIRFDSVPASNDVIFSLLTGHHANNVMCESACIYCITHSNSSLTAVLTPERALSRLSVLVRRNELLMTWGAKVKLHKGFTYFIRSQPHLLNRIKVTVYWAYFRQLCKRFTMFFAIWTRKT